MKRLRLIALAGLLAVLPGCELALLDGASVMTTDKTLGDHIVSITSNKDCSTYRKNTSASGVYCREDEVQPTPKVHCYQTLGSVSCYEQPDKTRAELGRNDQNFDVNANAGK